MCSSHELQATLNALGYLEDGEYYKGRDCLNAAKDLIRFLKRDDPTEKSMRRELLKSDTISNDLIPMLKKIQPKKEHELFDIVLRLLVNLTQSALNCFELKVPDDKLHYAIYLEIDNRLKATKEMFADEDFIKVLNNRLNDIIHKEWQDRPEEEELILERILYLIRNILLIKNSEHDEENRLETDLNSHDQLLLTFHNTKLLETLTIMSHSKLNTKYVLHLLEIITLLLKEQSAEELAKVKENEVNLASKRSNLEKEKDGDELIKIQSKDVQLRKHNKFRLNPRHSRFMGTYVAVNMKSINDENKLIVHKQPRNMDDLLDDSSKKVLKKAKNKIFFDNNEQSHKSVLFIRIILKKFCESFLESSYGKFFKNIKDLIQRKKMEDDEICYYYWLIEFFTEFIRYSDKPEHEKILLIKETFSLELFHSIEVFLQRCKEMMKVDKKLSKLWAKRMHTSFKCYKENLFTLFALEKKISELQVTNGASDKLTTIDTNIDNSNEELVDLDQNIVASSTQIKAQPVANLVDQDILENLKKIKDQLFYIQEFREMFLLMLKDFDPTKMSKNFLRDLIEGNHAFIAMLEQHKKAGKLNVQCKKKKRKTIKKAKEKKTKETKEEKEARLGQEKDYQRRVDEQSEETKTKFWEKNMARVSALIQNQVEIKCEEDNLMPFDFVATSDQEFDSQKDVVIEKIQHLLGQNKPDDSIALFREARYLWPNDKELFGNTQIAPEDEFETYKNLIMKKLEIKKPEPVKNIQKEEEEAKKNKKSKNIDDEEDPKSDEGIEDDLIEGENVEELYDEDVNNEEFGDIEEDGDDGEGGGYIVEEENLDFERFLFRYTQPTVIKGFILALSEYHSNSDFLNRCCMNMFERISYECHAPQCLYQLSLFNLINKIYKDPLSRCMMDIADPNKVGSNQNDLLFGCSSYTVEDMFSFFRQLLKKFFEQTTKNPKLFLEVLFFKDKKIITELAEDSEGYTNINVNNSKKASLWTDDEELELKQLYERFKSKKNEENENDENPENPDPILEKYPNADLIDLIMLTLKNDTHSRREVINKLVNIRCIESIDEFKKKKGYKMMGRNKLWRENDIEDLRQCFAIVANEAKETNKHMSEMMQRLQDCLKIKRKKSDIIDKLLEIELVTSRSDLMSSKKSSKKKSRDHLDENDKQFIDDDEDGSKVKKKKAKSKNKKGRTSNENSQEKNNDNDKLFDAESSSDDDQSDTEKSSSSSSSSTSSSSENEQEQDEFKKQAKNKKNKKFQFSEDSNSNDSNKFTEPLSQNESDKNSDNQMRKAKSVKRKIRNKKILQIINDESSNSTTKSDSDEEENNKSKPIITSNIHSNSDNSDDDLPLNELLSSKRQRLILSEDDD